MAELAPSPDFQSRTLRVDYIGLLPVEITLEILISLALNDVLSCMLVSRGWYARITTLGSYWRHALLTLIPPSLCDVAYRSRPSADHRELVLRAWQSRECLRAARPVVQPLTLSVPPHVYFQCNHAHHTTIVSTLYCSFIPRIIVVYRLQPGTGKLVKKHLFKPISSEAQSRIVWAHHFCDYLLLVSASGHWRGFNLAFDRLVLDWQGPPVFDSDIVFGCCESCFMVVAGKLISSRYLRESYWEGHLFRLGRGMATPSFSDFHVYTSVYMNRSVVSGMQKKLVLLSRSSRSRDKEGFCERHWLFMQSIEGVYVYQVDLPSILLPTSLTTLNFHYSHSIGDEDVVVSMYDSVDTTKNTAFKISLDNGLLGCISSDKLHVWKLSDEGFAKESVVSIPRRNRSSVRLLAIGHLYSILGYESVEGHFQVITTHRGDPVFSTYGFSGLGLEPSSSNGTPPPYFTFLVITNEEWLNDGCGLPHPYFPFMLFWDKKRHAILGLSLKHNNGNYRKVTVIQSTNRKWTEPIKDFVQRFR